MGTARAERQNAEVLRSRYEEGLPVPRELFYTHLPEGRIPPEQAADRAARPEPAFLYGDAVLAAFHGGSVYALIEALNRVCALAEGAKSALDYRGLVGSGQVVCIGDPEPDAGAGISFDESDERELAGAVKPGGGAEMRTAVEHLTDRVRRSGLAASRCNLFFLELLTCLLRLVRGAELDVEEVFGTGFTGTVQATDLSSFDALGGRRPAPAPARGAGGSSPGRLWAAAVLFLHHPVFRLPAGICEPAALRLDCRAHEEAGSRRERAGVRAARRGSLGQRPL